MRSLITSGVSPAAVSTFQEPQAMNVFAAGQSVFLRNWDYAYSYATTPATSKLTKSQVGVAPMPTFQGQSPGLLQHRRLEHVHQPAQQAHRPGPHLHQVAREPGAQDILAMQYSEIPTVESARTSSAVIASNPVLAIVPKTRLVPRPAGMPELPGAEHRDLHQRERDPGGLGVTLGGSRLRAEPGRQRSSSTSGGGLYPPRPPRPGRSGAPAGRPPGLHVPPGCSQKD